MKKLITFIFLSFFLFVGCGENGPIIIDDDKEEDNEEEDMHRPPEELVFTVEDPEAKSKLIGVWSLIFVAEDKNDDIYFPYSGTFEFLPDGTYRRYSKYPDEYTESETYQISDQYFYSNYIGPDEVPEEQRGNSQWIYIYKFYDDKLILELVWGLYTWETVYIYKKRL